MTITLRAQVLTFLVFLLAAGSVWAQPTENLQYFRAPGLRGITVFEAPKQNTATFEGFKVYVGGDFAIQFQGLTHSNDADNLIELSNNFTLPTANLNLDVQIEEGVRMHLRTYLSSKHHNEAWVKGGYFQVDNLDFISEGFMEELMQNLRLRFGMDQFNYGDTQFRRSDNAMTVYNPFVGNYIMDSFSTEPFAEVSLFFGDIIGVVGVTNGRLNQRPTPGDDGFAMFAKLGYDSQVNEDLRFRLTGSVYNSTDKGTRDYLYNGDRAGSRYYKLFETADGGSDFVPRFNTGFAYQTAFQINPFVKFQGFELFGVVEVASNGNGDVGGSFTQLGAEALFRFGTMENFYIGGRFNAVSGESADGADTKEITRINVGGGWFLTPNVLSKIEYVTSTYDGAGWTGSFAGAEFSGVVLEAAISF